MVKSNKQTKSIAFAFEKIYMIVFLSKFIVVVYVEELLVDAP